MATFPENDVEVLRFYELEDSLRTGIIQNLDDKPKIPRSVPAFQNHPAEPLPENNTARAIVRDRRGLKQFLSQHFRKAHSGSQPIDRAYTDLLNREYANARTKAIKLASVAIQGFRAGGIVNNALRTDDVEFTGVERDFIFNKPIFFKVPGSILEGYDGPLPNNAQRDVIVEVFQLLGQGAERDFRIKLIEAECFLGERDFETALDRYDDLMGLPSAPPQAEAKRKFAALRAGFAHLSFGDHLFRSARLGNIDHSERARKQYVAARNVVEASGVSPDNPLHAEIVDYAKRQEAKLAGGLNFLGYSDQFVPDRRFEALLDAALQRVERCRRVRDSFEAYLTKANQLENLEEELALEKQTAADRITIAENDLNVANRRVDATERNIERIEDSQLFQDLAAVPETIGAAAKIFKPDISPAEKVSSIAGLASVAVNFFARRQELSHQKELAKIERDIAEFEKSSAEVELRIAQRRFAFISEKLDDVAGGRLNKDLYYALANTYENLTLEHLDAAIRNAFQAERAAAFELGDAAFPRFISLEYLEEPRESDANALHGFFVAPDALDADLLNLKARHDNQLATPSPFSEPISLREEYPIEFSLFLQSGSIDFVVSLYELDKLRSGTFNRRLLTVEVEIIGLVPSSGIRGTLRHVGPFLLRDRAATLDGATRLIPTDEDFQEAMEEIQRGKVLSVGGVTWFNPGPEIKELSVLDLTTERQLLGKSPEVRGLFEGYGATGLWRLELPPETNPNLNFGNIADVIIRFHFVSAERDPALETKVKQLVADYEEELAAGDQLDRITAISMRQRLADMFFALETGSTTFEIRDSIFPSSVANALVKTVILQAIDENAQGVAGVTLELDKDGASLPFGGTTRDDGFTVDIEAEVTVLPQSDRFPVEGAWTLRLTDNGQFGRFHDVQLFIVYESN
jgi:hypothetical protein